MDTQYTVVMDPDDVRLEPVEIDYEANKGDGFRERKLSDSFEPLEVRRWCISVRSRALCGTVERRYGACDRSM